MTSISSSLRETISPRDFFQDAIHNFSYKYRDYVRHSNDEKTRRQTPKSFSYTDSFQQQPSRVIDYKDKKLALTTTGFELPSSHSEPTFRNLSFFPNTRDPEKISLLNTDSDDFP